MPRQFGVVPVKEFREAQKRLAWSVSDAFRWQKVQDFVEMSKCVERGMFAHSHADHVRYYEGLHADGSKGMYVCLGDSKTGEDHPLLDEKGNAVAGQWIFECPPVCPE